MRKFSTVHVGRFSGFFLNRVKVFSRKLKSYWKCREKNKSFQTTLVILFCSFTRFCYSFNWPQLERNLISSIGKFLYVVSQAAKRADVYNIKKNENIKRILNSIEDKNSCTVSFAEIKLWHEQRKCILHQI